jgi:PAS domain S-box-containing protein
VKREANPEQLPNVLDRVHPQDRGLVEQTVADAIATCSSFVMEYRIIRPDGVLRHIEGRGECIASTSGKAALLRGTVRDITQYKQSAEELRRNKERMEEAQRVAHIGDWEWDIINDHITLSDEYYRIIGYAPQSMNLSLDEGLLLVHPEDRSMVQTAFQRAMQFGGSFQFDYRIVRPNGELRYVEGRGKCQTDSEGKPVLLRGTAQDITDRKLVEHKLQVSSERLIEAQRMAGIGSWNWDLETGIIDASDEFFRLLGLAPQSEVLTFGRFRSYVHPDDLEYTGSNISRALESCGSFHHTYRIIGADEVVRHVEGRGECHSIVNGKATGMRGSTQDVTAQIESRARLENTLSLLKATVEAIGEGLIVVDQAAQLVLYNEKFVEMWGIPRDMIERGDDRPVLHHKAAQVRNPEKFLEEVASYYSRPEAEGFDTVELKDGRIFERHTSPEMVNGVAVGRVWTFRDITRRVQAEEAQHQSEARFAELAAAMDEIFWMIDATSQSMLYVSPAVERMLSLAPEELLGDSSRWMNLVHEEDRELVVQLLEQLLSGSLPKGAELECRMLRVDGSIRWARNRLRCMLNDQGQVTALCGVTEDITAHKEAEHERERLERQLAQSQKMESIGRLAGGVAHDFNNMLSVINGYSELVLEQLPPDSALRDDIGEILNAGQRAALITHQLLAFSRQQLLTPRLININAVVSEIEKMLRRLIGEDIVIATILDPTLSRVLLDPGQVVQVLMNLAVNARDAMPQGGKLTIETKNIYVDEERSSQMPYYNPGPHVLLSVSDNGVGMPPDVKARIFEPFYTTKELGKGTGLGLSTVYGIIKQSGGNIEVYSEPNLGTTFKLYFPAHEDSQGLPAVVQPQVIRGGSETILLVEDDAPVLKIAAAILRDRGYNLLTAGSGQDALALAASYEGEIHLLLTDLVMPEMGGRQVAEAIWKTRPEIKVLYMSGYTDDAVVRHGLLSGETAFLQKPFTSSSITQKVREALDKDS